MNTFWLNDIDHAGLDTPQLEDNTSKNVPQLYQASDLLQIEVPKFQVTSKLTLHSL